MALHAPQAPVRKYGASHDCALHACVVAVALALAQLLVGTCRPLGCWHTSDRRAVPPPQGRLQRPHADGTSVYATDADATVSDVDSEALAPAASVAVSVSSTPPSASPVAVTAGGDPESVHSGTVAAQLHDSHDGRLPVAASVTAYVSRSPKRTSASVKSVGITSVSATASPGAAYSGGSVPTACGASARGRIEQKGEDRYKTPVRARRILTTC